MKKLLLVLLALSTIGVVNSCKHETPKPPDPPPVVTPVTKSDKCSLDTVYFVDDILPIFQANCASSGCHDATTREDEIQLTDYDNIVKGELIVPGDPSESKIYKAITDTDPRDIMPPPPASLSIEQINAIRIWISQGAKNNDCDNICDTTDVSFSSQVWPIMQTTCAGCHGGINPSGGVPIKGYSDVKSLVDNGALLNVLNRKGPRKPMPPGGPLEQCAYDQIRIWIREGAQNN